MSTTGCGHDSYSGCIYSANTTAAPTNDSAPADHQKTQEEVNAETDHVMVPLLLGVGGLLLLIGAFFWIRKRTKKYRASRANNANDIELQQRAEPEPASPEHAPRLFYLNQDHASGIEAPPPTYSATSIREYAKGVLDPKKV